MDRALNRLTFIIYAEANSNNSTIEAPRSTRGARMPGYGTRSHSQLELNHPVKRGQQRKEHAHQWSGRASSVKAVQRWGGCAGDMAVPLKVAHGDKADGGRRSQPVEPMLEH